MSSLDNIATSVKVIVSFDMVCGIPFDVRDEICQTRTHEI